MPAWFLIHITTGMRKYSRCDAFFIALVISRRRQSRQCGYANSLKAGRKLLTYILEQGSNAYLKPLGNEIQGGERHIRFSAFNLAHVAAVNAALVRK
jgi:hypothetical protein